MRSKDRTRRLAFVLMAIVFGVALLAAGCGSSSDDDTGDDNAPAAQSGASTSGGSEQLSADNPKKVRIAFTPAFGLLPIHIADVKGFFKQNGIEVTRTEGLELPAYTAALGRQYDIVMNTPSGFLAAASQGLDVKAVSHAQTTSPEHRNNVLVTKQPIKDLAELKGKTIGVPSLAGTSAECLIYLLDKAGVKKNEVKLIQVPFDTAGDQMKAGRLDAVVSAIPFYTGLQDMGFTVGPDVVSDAVRVATDGKQDVGIGAMFVSSSKYIQENPDVIAAWRKSLQEAEDYIASNEKDARTIMGQWLKLDSKVAQGSPMSGFAVKITAADIAPFVQVSTVAGSIKSAPDVNTLVAP